MKKDYEALVDKAVEALCLVKDNVIELVADYRDDAEFLKETLYEERNFVDLRQLVGTKIYSAYYKELCDLQEKILKKAGVIGEEFEEDAREYLRDAYCIAPPYDHFLGQEIKVNIMLATNEERNRDCVSIHEQYLAMNDPEEVWRPEETLAEPSGLTWLLEQQGHSMAELQATMKDYNEFFYDAERFTVREMFDENGNQLRASQKVSIFNQNHNAFLTSVCQELENQGYSMGVMTVLAEMSIEDFIKMQGGEKQVTMPANSDIGIFNPWNGSGSCLEIELEKPLVFSTDMVRDVQIEGVKPQWEYTVDDVYGLVGSCWKQVVSIVDEARGKTELQPALDDVVQSCEGVCKKDEKGTIERDFVEH